jgi:hypothetical protein
MPKTDGNVDTDRLCFDRFYFIARKKLLQIAAKVAVTTLNGSVAGGLAGLVSSYVVFKGHFSIDYIIVSVMSGLVSITASCAIISPTEALVIGCIGAFIALGVLNLLERIEIDDRKRFYLLHYQHFAEFEICYCISAIVIVFQQLERFRSILRHPLGGHYRWVSSDKTTFLCSMAEMASSMVVTFT